MNRNHKELPADDAPKSGGNNGSNSGARNKAHLRNDNGNGGGRFVDTDNANSGDGHGGPVRKLR